MTNAEKMLLEDAIHTAIEAERKIIVMRRQLLFFIGLSFGLALSCTSLVVRLMCA